VGGCGAFTFLVPVGSGTIEALWKVTEDRLHEALDAVCSGTLFSNPGAQANLRDAISLHYARSIHTLRNHYAAVRQTWEQQRKLSIERLREQLAEHFYRMTGLEAVGDGALEIAFDDVAKDNIEVFTEGWPFPIEDRRHLWSDP
jgi:hypothetical protein